MPTMPCPRCRKPINKRGCQQHIRYCRGAIKSAADAAALLPPITAHHSPLTAATGAESRGRAMIALGAFRRDLVFADLTDLQTQLTVMRFELADTLALLGCAPQPPLPTLGCAAIAAPLSLPEHKLEQAAARATADAPRRLSPPKTGKRITHTCPHCNTVRDARGYYRHLAKCERLKKSAPVASAPAAVSAGKPSATGSHLDITRRALARCRAELEDPKTNDGRKAYLRDEIRNLEAKLAAGTAPKD